MAHPFNMTRAEMVATILECAEGGHTEGTLGRAINISADTAWTWRIEVAPTGPAPEQHGYCCLARRGAHGWEIQAKGFVGINHDPEEAARLAIEAARGVSVTRNYPLG